MAIARRELGPRVADADHRLAVKHVLGETAILEPGSVEETVLVLAPEPCLAAQFPAHIRLLPNSKQVYGIRAQRSEEHTSELQSLMRTSYAVFCLKKKKKKSQYKIQK